MTQNNFSYSLFGIKKLRNFLLIFLSIIKDENKFVPKMIKKIEYLILLNKNNY
jgi:hypothetical protein